MLACRIWHFFLLRCWLWCLPFRFFWLFRSGFCSQLWLICFSSSMLAALKLKLFIKRLRRTRLSSCSCRLRSNPFLRSSSTAIRNVSAGSVRRLLNSRHGSLLNEQLWVVGAFAGEFDPLDRLHEKKYENALYKVLAAVGVVVQKLKMERRKVALHLSILLPWQEFNDRGTFETQLRVLLDGFVFRDQAMKVKLKSFLCRPEGGGLAATRMRQQGLDWFQEQRLVVLLFGHRNTSALYFEYGQFKAGDSPLYGFSQMIDLLVARYSVLDKQALLLALVKAMQTAREEHGSKARMYESANWGRHQYGPVRYPSWRMSRALNKLVAGAR